MGVHASHRSTVVDWMLDVVTTLGYSGEPAFDGIRLSNDLDVFFLAVHLMDVYFARCEVPTDVLQLCGATALLLAAKLTSVYAPEVQDLLRMCDGKYTSAQLCAHEHVMFEVTRDAVWTDTLLMQLQHQNAAEPLTDARLRRTLHYCELAVVASPDQSWSVLARCMRLGRKRNRISQPEGERLSATYRRHR